MKITITPRARKTKKGYSIYLDKYINGKRTTETIMYNVSKREKNKFLVEAENTAKKILNNYTSCTLYEIFDEFLESYNKKDLRVIQAVVKQFKKFNGEDILLNELNGNILKEFRYYLGHKSGLNGETPSSYSIRFKKILKYLFDFDLISSKVLNSFKIITDFENDSKKTLDKAEFYRLYQNLDFNDEVKKAFLFSCLTGLGFSEIKRLEWKHIDLSNQILKIKRSKSKKYIDIEMHSIALNIIGAKKSHGFVFDVKNSSNNKFLSDFIVNKKLKLWMKENNINKHITYYCSRHSYCNYLFESANQNKLNVQTSFYTISKGMGHSHVNSTFRYLNNYKNDVYALTSNLI